MRRRVTRAQQAPRVGREQAPVAKPEQPELQASREALARRALRVPEEVRGAPGPRVELEAMPARAGQVTQVPPVLATRALSAVDKSAPIGCARIPGSG